MSLKKILRAGGYQMPKIVDIEQNKRLRKLLPEWLRLVEHSYSWIAKKLNVSNSLITLWLQEKTNISKPILDELERIIAENRCPIVHRGVRE